MNSNNRRIEIFNLLTNEKKVDVNKLAEEFDVTTMTIRRDLKELEKQGLVTVFYGGATLNENGAIETSFAMRKPKDSDIKLYIAYQASKYIKDGDTIYIDGGTTCYNICKFLKNKKITVLTNSLRTIDILKDCENVKVVLCPGEFNKIQEITVGYSTIDFLNSYHVNKAFISTTGLSIDIGLTMADEMESRVKRKVIEISDIKYLLVDHTKFNKQFFINYAKIDDFDVVITDEETSIADREAILKLGIELDLVNTSRNNK